MTNNDTSTLNGALQELGETMAANLVTQGVQASASDGLTTLAGKILDIQGGGSCYHIEFSEASYTAVGGSATLEISLQENYAPKSGATVTVTGSDSSLYTGITNTDGVAQVTVTNVSGTVTFTGSYSNVSAQCTVTGQTYLFFDDCSTNRISEYTTKGNQSITYNSNGYYTISTTSQSCPNVKINSFTAPNKVKISADFRMVSGSNIQPKLCLFDESKSKGYGLRITQNNHRWNLQTYTSWTDCGNNLNETTYNTSLNVWYHFELVVNENSLTGNLYNEQGTLLATITSTGSLNLSSTGNYVGIGLNYTSSTSMNVKNIKVEPL